MDTLLFLLMFVACAVVLGWYMSNEFQKAPGDKGLLGVARGGEAEAATAGAAYRTRPARSRATRGEGDAGGGRYRPAGTGRAYAEAPGAAFRDRSAGYREKPRRANDA